MWKKGRVLAIIIGGLIFPAHFLLAATLSVPFTSQAPQGNWSQPWYDACEETSIVMVDYYYNNKTLTVDLAAKEILAEIDYKNAILGESLDENVDTMLYLIKQTTNWQGQKISNPSLSLLKQEIDNGRPIILPVAGDLLRNPHFKGTVPYHVLVLKGYDDSTQEFIVNDPGTMFGNSYRYSYPVIENAIHDFVARDSQSMLTGPKYVIFTNNDIENYVDGSLLKSANDPKVYYITNKTKQHISSAEIFLANNWSWSQIKIASQVYLNGLTTGSSITSVITSYKPTVYEKSLISGTLIKSKESPKVYLLSNNQRQYIVSPQVFVNHNWSWSQVKTVSENFINYLPKGQDIKQ